MDDNNIEAVACEEGSGQKSVFIDGFTAEEGWIINKTTGEKYPDVPIRRISILKTRYYKATSLDSSDEAQNMQKIQV
ncbi:MAG: hypothetical protein PUB64_01515 [Firmicutes bacterium]|nr:hypothetical protein [Bacillota bacterium]